MRVSSKFAWPAPPHHPTSTPGLPCTLQVVDLASLAQGQSHQYCIYATGGPLRVTLVWYDWPGDPNAGSVLVNNLDLQVGEWGGVGDGGKSVAAWHLASKQLRRGDPGAAFPHL